MARYRYTVIIEAPSEIEAQGILDGAGLTVRSGVKIFLDRIGENES